MTTTTTTLTLKKSPVAPPPRKAEIIEALARKEHASQTAAYKEADERKKAARKACEKAILQFIYAAKDNAHPVDVGDIYMRHETWAGGRITFEVRLNCNNPPPAIAKLIREYHAMKCPSVSDMKTIRRVIKERINGCTTDRVQALLNDPASSKALDAMLKKIKQPSNSN